MERHRRRNQLSVIDKFLFYKKPVIWISVCVLVFTVVVALQLLVARQGSIEKQLSAVDQESSNEQQGTRSENPLPSPLLTDEKRTISSSADIAELSQQLTDKLKQHEDLPEAEQLARHLLSDTTRVSYELDMSLQKAAEGFLDEISMANDKTLLFGDRLDMFGYLWGFIVQKSQCIELILLQEKGDHTCQFAKWELSFADVSDLVESQITK